MESKSYKTYVDEINKKNHEIEFQKMIIDMAFEFMNLDLKNFNEKISILLKELGNFFNVDRTYLFTINYDNNTLTYGNEWCRDGISPEVGTIEQMGIEIFPWWISQLHENRLVYVEDVNQLPEEAGAEKLQLQRQGVKSLVSVPVLLGNKIYAFIGMDSVHSHKSWTSKNIELLYTMSDILSRGFSQIKSDMKIKFMALYDNLTELPNQFLFQDRVEEAIKASKRNGKFLSIVFIDLDNFKAVNDTIGRSGGDELLKKIANGLSGTIRKTDTISRFSGDEFMILLNHVTDYSDVAIIMDKIMGLFSETFYINQHEFLITASAGIAIHPFDGSDSETLIKNADIALYSAKSKGKNQYIFCNEQMKEKRKLDIEISKGLYSALDNDELFIYYQPQVDLTTNQITGLEALLRWTHPALGNISPTVFIPIAEKNGLINRIGDWVLREACIQIKKWQDMEIEPIKIGVNISAVQLINPNIADNIEEIIKETGLSPEFIELEITERISIKGANYVIDLLNKLKKIGLTIAIDDFGTAYSSLTRLKWLPIDRIKIDMQFVKGIESSEKDRAITKSVIDLSKNMGLNALAEGVETKAQLDFLKENGCDCVQGYYFYKPMSAENIEKLLLTK